MLLSPTVYVHTIKGKLDNSKVGDKFSQTFKMNVLIRSL